METYYDYDNQCWIKSGIIQRCGHPESMNCNCFGRHWAGWTMEQVVAELKLK